MIYQDNPASWQDLQEKVAQIFLDCGIKSETPKEIKTVRGIVNIDVHSEDFSTQPTTVYLCECKYWKNKVPKTIVHAFRTVVADYGANWGFIISSKGFQLGAFEAAGNSNIRLLTWAEFQNLFIDRWIENFMVPLLDKEVYPLVEYTQCR